MAEQTDHEPGQLEARDDNALMARVAARDGQAFRVLVDAHTTMLYRIGYRMLGDAAAAEDVAQDALLRLWHHAARWQGQGPGVAAWLRRVATNLCLDRLRKRRFVSDDAVPERADDGPSAAEQMDEQRMRAQTIEAIATLPDRQRAAIILTYYEECSNLEAASVLGLNIKAFESLLLRARGALRRVLEGEGFEPAMIAGGRG